jgi:hypothetical protein
MHIAINTQQIIQFMYKIYLINNIFSQSHYSIR